MAAMWLQSAGVCDDAAAVVRCSSGSEDRRRSCGATRNEPGWHLNFLPCRKMWPARAWTRCPRHQTRLGLDRPASHSLMAAILNRSVRREIFRCGSPRWRIQSVIVRLVTRKYKATSAFVSSCDGLPA